MIRNVHIQLMIPYSLGKYLKYLIYYIDLPTKPDFSLGVSAINTHFIVIVRALYLPFVTSCRITVVKIICNRGFL